MRWDKKWIFGGAILLLLLFSEPIYQFYLLSSSSGPSYGFYTARDYDDQKKQAAPPSQGPGRGGGTWDVA